MHMQGMMVQDFKPSGKTTAAVAAKEVPDSSEKPFGEVLGSEEKKVVAQPKEQTSEQVAKEDVVTDKVKSSEQEEQEKQEKLISTHSQEVEEKGLDEQPGAADSGAAPFFMAALFDQSAPFVTPPENADLVVAAERTQELIGAWLQPQQEGTHDLGEVLATALEVLEQATEVPSPDAHAVEAAQPVLSDAEIAELKGLMAVMLQSGQVPESFAEHPLVADLKKQLASVPEFRFATAQTAQTAQTFGGAGLAATLDRAPGPDVVAESAAPVADASLQEDQIARLLKPRQEPPTLREEYAAKGSLQKGNVQVAATVLPQNAAVLEAELEPTDDITLKAVKVDAQSLAANLQTQVGLNAATVGPQQGPQFNSDAPKIMQLPSGLKMAESQLVDQVVTHLAGSTDGESGRMRLRLHPAELGSVRLDLIIEGDRLRAHLQTQTHQVQEVLDRNLAQLKAALQQQGLKIDEFRVDVQSSQDQSAEQGFAWQQQQQQQSSPQSPWLDPDWQQQELEIPLQQLVQNAGGGISLRV
ncbi:MAG: flagellar hook-length control protein FliK [Geopsychrobacter sp.]|nr:flagellar hook-length control protein FliK [Geopsychrobacter sp.]